MLLMVTTSARANDEKTTTITIAAPVMTLAVFARPSATAAVLSPERRYDSWIRESSRTS